MKKLMPLFAAALMFASCGNSTHEEAAATTTPAEETKTEAAPIAKGPIDPVCEMERDASWTLYTANGADTVWFCSETCKEAYDKNPSKYAGKTGS